MNRPVIDRLRQKALEILMAEPRPEGVPKASSFGDLLPSIHVLDLAPTGWIKPHVDSIRVRINITKIVRLFSFHKICITLKAKIAFGITIFPFLANVTSFCINLQSRLNFHYLNAYIFRLNLLGCWRCYELSCRNAPFSLFVPSHKL